MTSDKHIVLNLFFMPVVLVAFYLGRYRAGVLSLFCVIFVSLVIALNPRVFLGPSSSLLSLELGIIVWGAALGLTSILVGTLSDERSEKIVELHEAHVGVVEILAKYLQSADAHLQDRSHRVSELSQRVSKQMKFSAQEIDNIRVAALLHDMENLEITARVVRKAVGDLEVERKSSKQHTFNGVDLVHSLGSVLTDAFPLVLNLNDLVQCDSNGDEVAQKAGDVPFGAKIIGTVRAYDTLIYSNWGESKGSPQKAISELRHDPDGDHHPAVLHALEQIILQKDAESETPNVPKVTEEVVAEVAEPAETNA
jgi:HD-GYP domain-containing protein (c-di-GMP phosphodiesterase class II)